MTSSKNITGVINHPDTYPDDYYPACSVNTGLPNRHKAGNEYRYGVQGQEKDDEVSGEGNSYTAEFWQYDCRVDRWLSRDPKASSFSWQSSYSSMNNNPLMFADPLGDSSWGTIDDVNKIATLHVTGKVIDKSGTNVDVQEAISDMTADIEATFQGSVEYNGEQYKFETDIQLEEVTNLNDISSSDHLFVLSKNAKKDRRLANGVSSRIGGKVAFIGSEQYATKSVFSWGSNTRPTVHEFGHLMGLKHTVEDHLNLMKSGGTFWGLEPKQFSWIIVAHKTNGLTNLGKPVIQKGDKLFINTILVDENNKCHSLREVRMTIDNSGDKKQKPLQIIPYYVPTTVDQDSNNPNKYIPRTIYKFD